MRTLWTTGGQQRVLSLTLRGILLAGGHGSDQSHLICSHALLLLCVRCCTSESQCFHTRFTLAGAPQSAARTHQIHFVHAPGTTFVSLTFTTCPSNSTAVTYIGTWRRGLSRTPARPQRDYERWCSSVVPHHPARLRPVGGPLPPWRTHPAPVCTAHTSACSKGTEKEGFHTGGAKREGKAVTDTLA